MFPRGQTRVLKCHPHVTARKQTQAVRTGINAVRPRVHVATLVTISGEIPSLNPTLFATKPAAAAPKATPNERMVGIDPEVTASSPLRGTLMPKFVIRTFVTPIPRPINEIQMVAINIVPDSTDTEKPIVANAAISIPPTPVHRSFQPDQPEATTDPIVQPIEKTRER